MVTANDYGVLNCFKKKKKKKLHLLYLEHLHTALVTEVE